VLTFTIRTESQLPVLSNRSQSPVSEDHDPRGMELPQWIWPTFGWALAACFRGPVQGCSLVGLEGPVSAAVGPAPPFGGVVDEPGGVYGAGEDVMMAPSCRGALGSCARAFAGLHPVSAVRPLRSRTTSGRP
jgi:hypothetical protein